MENQKQSTFSKLVNISLFIAIIVGSFSILSIFSVLIGPFSFLEIFGFLNSSTFHISFLLSGIAFLIGIVASLVKREDNKFSLRLFLSFLLSLVSLIFFFYVYSVCVPCRLFSSRLCSKDAAVKSNIDSTRVAAELWYDNQFNSTGGGGSYEGVCNSPYFQRISDVIKIIAEKPMRCFSSKTAYCVAADEKKSSEWYTGYCIKAGLKEKPGEWCADSSGYAGPDANCSAEHLSCQ